MIETDRNNRYFHTVSRGEIGIDVLPKILRKCASPETCKSDEFYPPCPLCDLDNCGSKDIMLMSADAIEELLEIVEALNESNDNLFATIERMQKKPTVTVTATRTTTDGVYRALTGRIAELEAQVAFFNAEKQNYQENIEYRDNRIKELEAQLPKHGEWIDLYGHEYKCSVCGAWCRFDGTPEEEGFNYCPNCGAMMVDNGESTNDSN